MVQNHACSSAAVQQLLLLFTPVFFPINSGLDYTEKSQGIMVCTAVLLKLALNLCRAVGEKLKLLSEFLGNKYNTCFNKGLTRVNIKSKQKPARKKTSTTSVIFFSVKLFKALGYREFRTGVFIFRFEVRISELSGVSHSQSCRWTAVSHLLC